MTGCSGAAVAVGVLDDVQRRAVMKVLLQVPDRLEDLEVTITRTDVLRPEALGKSGHKDRVVPFNQRASDARRGLERVLRVYALRVALVSRCSAPHGAVAQAKFLCDRLPGVPGDAPSIEGIYAAVVGAAGVVVRAIDRPVERRYAGVCDCGTRLYAAGGVGVVVCGGCGLRWPAVEVRAWMLEQVRGTLGSAAELSRLLPWFDGRPVRASTISKWAERGRLRSVVVGGRVVYRIGDVLALHGVVSGCADVA